MLQRDGFGSVGQGRRAQRPAAGRTVAVGVGVVPVSVLLPVPAFVLVLVLVFVFVLLLLLLVLVVVVVVVMGVVTSVLRRRGGGVFGEGGDGCGRHGQEGLLHQLWLFSWR